MLAAIPLTAKAKDVVIAPTDEQALNQFVAHYNTYIGRLQSGLVDVKEWARVEQAWKRVTG